MLPVNSAYYVPCLYKASNVRYMSEYRDLFMGDIAYLLDIVHYFFQE